MSPTVPDGDAVEIGSALAATTPANGDGPLLAADPEAPRAEPVPAEVADPEAPPAEPVPVEVAEPETPEEPEPGIGEPETPEDTQPGIGEPETPEDTQLLFEPDADPAQASLIDVHAPPDPLVTPPEMSQMLFVDVVLLLPATHPVVVLQEADPPYRELRIPVGGAEGIAIGYAARGVATPRPLTHELLAHILEEFGMTLDVVRITEVRGAAFTAEVVISGRLGARVIDCRPSDAIALALRHRLPVPIMASPIVMARAGTDPAGAN